MDFMELAFEQARLAGLRDEIPVGAVLVDATGVVLAADGNRTEAASDASAHAEILVMRAAAAKRGSPRLTGTTLYVTLEPCPMCAAAIGLFRLSRVVFGAYDVKGGGIVHGPRIFDAPGCLSRPEVAGGVREQECGALLRAFFATRR